MATTPRALANELLDVRVVGGDERGDEGVKKSPLRRENSTFKDATDGKAPSPFKTSSNAREGSEIEEEDDDDEWYDIARAGLYKRWNLAAGLILLALSAWFAAENVGGSKTWKYTGIAAGVLLGRSTSRWFVIFVVYVLENVLPLDKVAYYFDALSPALSTFLWYTGVALMWGLFFASELHGQAYSTTVKVLCLIGLWLLAKCLALLIVKMLTANLHAGTFWQQLKTTVRHEMMLRTLTGAPVRPRTSRQSKSMKNVKRSSSFSKGKPKSHAGADASHTRDESGASDSMLNEAELKQFHDNLHLGHMSSQTESDEGSWDAEKTNQNVLRVAEEQAKALANQATAVLDAKASSKNKKDYSIFNALALMKPGKAAAYMTHYVSAERVMERAKMTLGMEALTAESDIDMRRASKMIFNHIRRPGEKFITREAIADFLPSRDVDEAMDLLSGQDKFTFPAVGLQDLTRGIRKMFDERLLLGQTLQSMQGLAETLGRTLQIFFFVIIIIIGLFMFNIDVGSLWLLFSSSVLALTFIFGSSASRAFEAAVMIFAVHPFNIGDWIVIDGNNYKVLSLGINSTKLADLVGEVIYVPTSQLAQKPILNLSRSGELWMKIGLFVDIGITQQQCKHLENICLKFTSSDKRNYAGPCIVALRGFAEERLKVELNVLYSLAFNGSQRGMMIEAHSRMLFVVQSALLDLGVTFTGTDGMIFCHNPDTVDAALDPSTLVTGVPVTGAPIASSAGNGSAQNLSGIPQLRPAVRTSEDPFNRYPPHTTSYWRSNAMNQRYAMNSPLRHLSGMLKMD